MDEQNNQSNSEMGAPPNLNLPRREGALVRLAPQPEQTPSPTKEERKTLRERLKEDKRQSKLTKHVDLITSKIIDKWGDREEITQALAQSTEPKARTFLELLLDPRNLEVPIARLARMAKLDSIELASLMRSHHAAEAMGTFMRSAPKIAHDIVKDAESIQVECPRCNGFGRVQDPFTVTEANPIGQIIDCVRCDGSGLVRKSGDKDARALIAETIRWTKTKQPMVMVNNFNGGGIDALSDRMESALEQDNPRHRLERERVEPVEPVDAEFEVVPEDDSVLSTTPTPTPTP